MKFGIVVLIKHRGLVCQVGRLVDRSLDAALVVVVLERRRVLVVGVGGVVGLGVGLLLLLDAEVALLRRVENLRVRHDVGQLADTAVDESSSPLLVDVAHDREVALDAPCPSSQVEDAQRHAAEHGEAAEVRLPEGEGRHLVRQADGVLGRGPPCSCTWPIPRAPLPSPPWCRAA